MEATKRQRADGTFTFSTPEWDAKWYWPVGTRISLAIASGRAFGKVTKQNTVSAWVLLDSGETVKAPFALLQREVL
jgi:hypothetical protein